VTFHVSSSTADYLSTLSMSSASPGSDSELTGLDCSPWSPAAEPRRGDAKVTLLKVFFPDRRAAPPAMIK